MKNNQNLTLGVALILFFVSLTSCSQQQSPQSQMPNIVYISANRFRNAAMEFWELPRFRNARITSDPVHTPNLSSFAKGAFVSSKATSNYPSNISLKSSFFTGTYPNSNNMISSNLSNHSNKLSHKNLLSIYDIFNSNGYECAYIGNSHEYIQDSNYCYYYDTSDPKNPHYCDNKGLCHGLGKWAPLHEAIIAIEYLQNNKGQRKSSKPFFMMIEIDALPKSDHPNQCMRKDYERYKDIPIRDLLIRPNVSKEPIEEEPARCYFANITGIDRAFGMIIEELKRSNLDKNTIVVFSSGSGENLYSHETNKDKAMPYSEVTNVPFLIQYPGHIRPRMEPLMISTPDIMPTLLGLAKLQNSIPETVQGYNYAQLLLESEFNVLNYPESALFIQDEEAEKDSIGQILSYFPNGRGIKTSDFTLALFIDRKHKLRETLFFYDTTDPYQLNNLKIEEHKVTADKLLALLGKELTRIKDPWFEEKILSDKIPYN